MDVESKGFEVALPLDPAGAESLERTTDRPFETTPGVLESSADGSDATRESPLMPLTVGSHALEAVLFSGLVELWRGSCADVGGDDDGTGGAMWLKTLGWWVEFEDALVGVTVGAAGSEVPWLWPWV